MAQGNCLQLSTVSTTAARTGQSLFSRQNKLNLPISKPFLKLGSSFPYSISHKTPPHTLRFLCKAREAVNEVQVVTDASWDELVISSKTPVLVDFWAPWCGPCRMIAPVVDELAKEYAGKILCCKVNTDDCPNIATQYGIRSIPTVLFFKNGERKESVIGAVPKSTLTATIEKYLD